MTLNGHDGTSGDLVGPKTKLYAGAFLYAAAAAVLVLLVASLYYLVQGQHAAQASQKAAQENRKEILRAVDLLLECTTPPQERIPPVEVADDANDCYQRGLRQQGNAVASIGDLTIRAACAAEHARNLRAVERCVRDVTAYIQGEQSE